MKNCLLVFRNKKINIFASDIPEKFAESGYYFDKISYVAFDDANEIVGALKDGLEHDNLVISCPEQMQKTLKDYVSSACGVVFDGLGVLVSGGKSVFILSAKLSVAEVCENLNSKYSASYEKAYVKTVGAPLKAIKDAIEAAASECASLNFNVTEKYGECKIELVYDDKTPKSVFDRAFRVLVERLGEYIYALEDVTLAERLYHLLKLRRMKISVAESFTGGGVGAELVKVSGVSEVYFEGLNTYSNEAKIQRLGVDEFVINTYGAVSKETAAQMAQGLIISGNCDVSVATTGIAGPKSDNTRKPVGLAYIAVGSKEGADVFEYNFVGSREEITKTAINYALFAVFKKLK